MSDDDYLDFYSDLRRLSPEKKQERISQHKVLSEIENGPRKSGRSTRLINTYIEQLFQEGEAYIRDHHPYGECHKDLLGRLRKRLEEEHRMFAGIDYELTNKYTIKLRK